MDVTAITSSTKTGMPAATSSPNSYPNKAIFSKLYESRLAPKAKFDAIYCLAYKGLYKAPETVYFKTVFLTFALLTQITGIREPKFAFDAILGGYTNPVRTLSCYMALANQKLED